MLYRSALFDVDPEARDDPTEKAPTEMTHPDLDLVGYDYFAEQLGIRLGTVYSYASEKHALRLEYFPRPITPKGHRSPLFLKSDADAFIRLRQQGSTTGKGRVKPSSLTEQQRAAADAATVALGHEIDLEDRVAVRKAIYDELNLPVLTTTKAGRPAITHAALKKLYKQTHHPFLYQVLTYRGIDIPQL